MSEFITIQIGQCGNQIGGAFWPLVLEEYGLKNIPGGTGCHNSRHSTELSSISSFFNLSTTRKSDSLSNLKKFKHKARAVLIDMEDSVINNLKCSPLSKLFDEKSIITNYSGSGNNWAEGFCTHGSQFCDKILNALSNCVESCDSVNGFLLLYSVSGGTGSGLGSYVLKMLEDHFPHIDRFVMCVYATGTEDVITCPYNMALATKKLIDHASCVFPVENLSLIDIVNCQANNRLSPDTMQFVSKCKPFQDMNTIISKVLLHLTSGSRFQGSLNLDMNDIATNMIPFPNVNFLPCSLSPLSITSIKRTNSNDRCRVQNEIFEECCKRTNVLMKLDPLSADSRLMAATLLGRGSFSMSDMRRFVDKIKNHRYTIPWSKKIVKVGICDVPCAGHSLSMLSIYNTTAVKKVFEMVNTHFETLYRKRAYLHHYTEVPGFDLNYFDECRETLFSTINNYENLETMPAVNIPRYFS